MATLRRTKPTEAGLERAARDAAQRAEKGQAIRPVTASRPAAALAFTATGEALPDSLRARLEQVLDADLGAIRLHRDARAASSAAELQAQAYAAGAHIVWGARAPAPDSAGGFALLVHEAMHVLQQTGRHDAGGRVAARVVAGRADIAPQCEEVATWANIRAAHEAAEADPKGPVHDLAATLHARLKGSLTGLDAAREILLLADDIKAGKHDADVAPRQALLCDVMKISAQYDACFRLLDLRLESGKLAPMPTFLIRPATIAAMLVTNAEAWQRLIIDQERSATANKAIFALRSWLRAALMSFDSSLSEPAAITAAGKSVTDTKDDPTRLGPNERDAAAIDTAISARAGLATAIAKYRDLAAKDAEEQREAGIYKSPQHRLRWIASTLHGEAGAARRLPIRHNDYREHFFAGKIEAIAHEVMIFWNAAQTGMADAVTAALKLDRDKALAGNALVALPALEPVGGIRDALLGWLPELFRVAQDTAPAAMSPAERRGFLMARLPPAPLYDTAAAALLSELDQQAEALLPLIAERWNDGSRRAEALALGALGWWAQHLGAILARRHDPALPDEFLADRFELAGRLVTGGFAFQWLDIADLALPVRQAADAGFSYLILRGEWTRLDNAPLEEMRQDLPKTLMLTRPAADGQLESVKLPLRAEDFIALFEADYLEAVAAVLSDHLTTHEATPADTTPRLAAVVNPLDARPRPQRWEVKEHRYVRYGQDTTSARLVLLHPKTQALLGTTLKGSLAFSPEGDFGRASFWEIPALDVVREHLRRIPDVVDIVEAWDEEPADPFAWLFKLAQGNPQRLALAIELAAQRRAASAAAAPLLARASTLDRRVAAIAVRADFARHAKNRLIEKPLDIAEQRVQHVWRNAMPLALQDAHLTALMLDIGEDLDDAFEHLPTVPVREDWMLLITTVLAKLAEGGEELLDPVLGPGEDRATLMDGKAHLEAVLDRIEAARREQQLKWGIETDGTEFESLMSAYPVRPGEENGFVIALWSNPRLPDKRPEAAGPLPGDIAHPHYFEIVAIHRAFRYHPPILSARGAPDRPGILHDGSNGRIAEGTELVTLRWATVSGKGEALSYGPDQEVVIRAGDEAGLTLLTNVIDAQARQIGFESLAENIQAFQEGLLDLVELVPGVGQGVAAARLSVNVLNFVANELPKLNTDLFVKAQEELDSLVAALSDPAAFSGPRLWRFMLNVADGGPGLNPLGKLARDPRHQARNTRRAAAGHSNRRLARLIGAVRGIGSRIAGAVQRVQSRVAPRLASARADISARPRIAEFLRDLPHHLVLGRDLVAGARAVAAQAGIASLDDVADLVAALDSLPHIAALRDDPEALTGALQTLVDGIAEMELPDEVVPMDLVVEVVLAFALDRVAGRKGKIARKVLQATGLLDGISRAISDGLSGSALDLNTRWRNTLRPQLLGHFTSARDGLVSGFATVVRETTGGRVALVPPKTADIIVTNEPFPEIDLLPNGRAPASPWLDLSGGMPMPAALRAATEQSFGHDFGHVRLHGGEAGERMAQSFGARALATGSHVVLGKGASPATPAGRYVLAHELSHVLQQTGPRPLGRAHDQAVRPGRPGAGLRRDRAREAAADRMAASRGGARPVAVEGAGGEGLMASGADAVATAAEVAAALAEAKFARGLAEEIEKDVATPGDPAGMSEANAIGRGLRAELQKDDAAIWPDFLPAGETRRAARNLVLERGSPTLLQAIAAIARRAQVPDGKKPAKGKPAGTKLDHAIFVNILEGYVFSATGVSVGIALDAQHRVHKVRVRDVHLGRVDRQNAIWKAVIKAEAKTFTERQWTLIHARMRDRFPEPHGWHARETRLADELVTELKQSFNRATGMTFPIWKTYVDPDGRLSEPGLRVSTHGQLTPFMSVHRHSHHLPQFLLAEYFRNDNPTKMTGRGDAFRLPGFEPAGATSFDRFVGGGVTLDLNDLDPNSNRGAGMPAVALAAETHQRGRLHMSLEPSWEDDTTRPTALQGGTIHNHFFGTLRPKLAPLAASGAGDLTQAVNFRAVVDAPANEKTVKQEVLGAMRRTFHWLAEERMLPSFIAAVGELEAPYYERQVGLQGVALGNDDRPTGDYRATDPDTAAETVVKRLRAKQQERMASWFGS